MRHVLRAPGGRSEVTSHQGEEGSALDEFRKFLPEEVGVLLGREVAASGESFVFRLQGPGLFACEDWDSFVFPLS